MNETLSKAITDSKQETQDQVFYELLDEYESLLGKLKWERTVSRTF